MKAEAITTARMSQRYRINAQLGQGGMGTVYRVYDRLTQADVALKQVTAPLASPAGNAEHDPTLGLALEFRVLAGLRHPHIVAVLDYGFDKQRSPYYTMQLLEQAQSLTDYCQGRDDPTKIRLVLETLQALVYLHRRGIIHRDLKPANVLVTAEGSAKVLDFGLALLHDASGEFKARGGGTLAYMSPELLEGEAASVGSDLYAVGVMLYELFVGRRPFVATVLARLLQAIMANAPDLSPLPLALQPIVHRLLTRDLDARYGSAEEVIAALCAATDTPLPPESTLVRESFLQASTFVGRESELTTLLGALADLREGRGGFWLLGGESGVGKSRLVDEVRTRALVAGALVVRGQAVAQGGLPYHLWREVVRYLLMETTVSDLEAGILKPLVPDVALLLGRPIPDVPELLGVMGQRRLVVTMVELLRRLTQPLVLLLEDLHWAQESLAPLRQMLMVREQLPNLLVIGTYRDDERPTLAQELAGMQVMKLPRLQPSAVAALAQSMLGTAGAQPDVLDLLQRETEGNAFFMVETVRVLAEEAGTLSAVGAKHLPAAIRAGGIQRIIERRLSRMPAEWGGVLKQVAVAGRALDPHIVGQMTDPSQLDQFLQAGAAACVLEVQEGRWRFSHDKLRDGVLASLTAEERRAYNRAVAEAIEASYPTDRAYAEVLMEHWRLAEEPQREVDYLTAVARDLYQVHAEYGRAAHLAAHGATLLSEDDPRLPAILNLHSAIASRQGQLSEAATLAQRALSLAERLNSSAQVAESLHKLGVVAHIQGHVAEAHHYHEQSLTHSRAHGDRQRIARNLNDMGVIFFEQGEYVLARTHYEESLALRRELDDQHGLGESLINLGSIAGSQGDYGTAADYFRQSLAIRRTLGDRHGIAFCLNSLGAVAYYLGDYAAARAYYQESLDIRHSIGDKMGEARCHNDLGLLAHLQGNFPAAIAAFELSLALRRGVGDKRWTAESLTNLGAVLMEQGATQAARARFEESLSLSQETHDKRWTAVNLYQLGLLALVQGDYATATTRLDESVALREAIGDKQALALSLHQLGVVAHARGEWAVADATLTRSLALREEIGEQQGVAASLAQLGALALDRGEVNSARHQLNGACAKFRDLQDKRGVAESLFHLARAAYIERDSVTAQAYIDQALAEYRAMGHQLGMARCLVVVAMLQAGLGVPTVLSTLYEGLHTALEAAMLPEQLACLTVWGRWLVAKGEHDHAARLLALVETHPATPAALRDGALARLRHDIETAVGGVPQLDGEALELGAAVQQALERMRPAYTAADGIAFADGRSVRLLLGDMEQTTLETMLATQPPTTPVILADGDTVSDGAGIWATDGATKATADPAPPPDSEG